MMNHIPGASGCMNWEYLESSVLPRKFDVYFFLTDQKLHKILVNETAFKDIPLARTPLSTSNICVMNMK